MSVRTMPSTKNATVAARRLSVVGGTAAEPRRQLPPRHLPNRELREREYLTPSELERLLKAAGKRGRYGARDALAILMTYRHGLRVSELCTLRWDQVDFATARLTVHRLKGSNGATHPIAGDELRALRKLRREQEPGCRYVFMNERGAPMATVGFRKMLTRVGVGRGLATVHPHMLRHSCGFALADKGREVREIQDYLGHRQIQNTVRSRTPSSLQARTSSAMHCAASISDASATVRYIIRRPH